MLISKVIRENIAVSNASLSISPWFSQLHVTYLLTIYGIGAYPGPITRPETENFARTYTLLEYDRSATGIHALPAPQIDNTLFPRKFILIVLSLSAGEIYVPAILSNLTGTCIVGAVLLFLRDNSVSRPIVLSSNVRLGRCTTQTTFTP